MSSTRRWIVALGLGAIVLVIAFVAAVVLVFGAWIVFFSPAS